MHVVITERGFAGHFIGVDRCRYCRNTLVECGELRIVVSTVGNYRPMSQDATEIGHNRFYETMAFKATRDRGYWEADVCEEIAFESPWAIDHAEHHADGEADAMHDAVVSEIAASLERDLKVLSSN